MSTEKKYEVNGVKLTEAQFNKKVEEVEKMQSAKLVEVSPGVYKVRLHD